jgi:trigger factor
MKSSLENITNLQKKLNVEVPSEAVQAAYDRVFQQIQKQVEIKGFRKGKAPLTTIRSMYGDRVSSDVAQDLIQNFYVMALRDHKLSPVSYPDFEFDPPSELIDFKFSAIFDIRPEIVLKKYEDLEIEKQKYSFDEAQLEKVLVNIRQSRATLETVSDNRAAQKGDIAVIDFEGQVEGKPLEGGTDKNHQLELGSKQFIDGFEDAVIGMKTGETKNIQLKFPTPYHSEELAGKPVEFKVTLTAIKEKILPELTEDFLKSLGGPTNVEELKNSIRKDLEESDRKRIEDSFRNRLLQTLLKNNPVDVPPSLLKEQKNAEIEAFREEQSKPNNGYNSGRLAPDQIDDYVKKWDADFEKVAREKIQISFLVDEIASRHQLFCSKEDIENKILGYAKQTGLEESRIREFYSQEEQNRRLFHMITQDKVIDFLASKARIKEVDGPVPEEAAL